jgi:uncharacterized protein (DUF2126 family)
VPSSTVSSSSGAFSSGSSFDQASFRRTAEEIDRRLREAGIDLTLGGEPTYVPVQPEGPEWSVAADGPTKLRFADALARDVRARVWPGATLMLCPGKRYDGEVNPRWVLRLIRGQDGRPLAPWRARSLDPLRRDAALPWLEDLARRLQLELHPLSLVDPLDPSRQVWAMSVWESEAGALCSAPWPLAQRLRRLSPAPGPAGLRLPLEHLPSGRPRQVLTLELDAEGWALFLPPLSREPLERLLAVIAATDHCPLRHTPLAEPGISGLLPLDIDAHWQVVGFTADPGVLEVNLPVCRGLAEYGHWLEVLDAAGTAVGLRSWKPGSGSRAEGTGGGNHLLWGGPSLERNPFFRRPGWLAGILRYWQHHPSLSYLFCGPCVGPASQSPRPDEALGSLADLELAYRVLEELEQREPGGDHRELIGETLRHLHADRSGNNHRSEISVDKFWNPGVPSGCLGLIEFRALESMPHTDWMIAVALLWSSLATLLVDPRQRPSALRPWGTELHDLALLPSSLAEDLREILATLAAVGLCLDPAPFEAIWNWRFPRLLHWQEGDARLELREALEPWPLICDVPREGGFTSRFVDASLRRFELTATPALRERFGLRLNGRPLPLPDGPLAVRYRQHRLYPCLHPAIAPNLPLQLELHHLPLKGSTSLAPPPLGRWQLSDPSDRFLPADDQPRWAIQSEPWRLAPGSRCTVDLRL